MAAGEVATEEVVEASEVVLVVVEEGVTVEASEEDSEGATVEVEEDLVAARDSNPGPVLE